MKRSREQQAECACFVRAYCLVYSSTLKVCATCYFGTSVDWQRTTRRYMPEDRSIHHLPSPHTLLSQGIAGFWTLSIVRYNKTNREHNFSETESVSFLRWEWRHLLCWVLRKDLTTITEPNLALYNGSNRLVVPPRPTWGRKQIQFPKRCVL
jgi:hypothetical protein